MRQFGMASNNAQERRRPLCRVQVAQATSKPAVTAAVQSLGSSAAAREAFFLQSLKLPTRRSQGAPSPDSAAARAAAVVAGPRPRSTAGSSKAMPPTKREQRATAAWDLNWQCENCRRINPGAARTCKECSRRRPAAPRLVKATAPKQSLAQARGLVPAAVAPKLPTQADWNMIQETSRLRGAHKAPCPICLEPLALRDGVLLSCSHVFHAACLGSFERFARKGAATSGSAYAPSCPVCRQQHYHKHRYSLGAQWHRQLCATHIQAALRGWQCRLRYTEQRAAWYRAGRGGAGQRRRFYAGQLSGVAGRLDEALQARASEVDRVLMDADSQVAATKAAVWAGIQELERRAANRGQRSAAAAQPSAAVVPSARSSAGGAGAASSQPQAQSIDPVFVQAFKAPLQQAQARANVHDDGCHSTDCAICMAEARWGAAAHAPTRGAAAKTVALLTCSHVLHAACVASWERFQAGDATCPVCRAGYSRCDLDAVALQHLQ